MEQVLIIVTGLSLALALGMGALLARTIRDERRRSDARVAALVEMARDPGAAQTAAPLPPMTDLEVDLELSRGVPARDLFVAGASESHSAWRPRAAVAAALAALVLATGYLAAGRRSEPAAPAVQTAAPAAAPAPASAPLELLSLTHTQDRGLTVTGLVQNPRGAAPRTKVIVTAFAFGADGAFLASGRAPLDFTTLAPGEESPFVVAIPDAAAAARYRVGFRAEDGEVIAHVDKRSAPAATTGSGGVATVRR